MHVDLSRLLSEGSGVVRQVVAARIRRTEQGGVVPSDDYAQGVLKAYQGDVAGEAMYRAAAEAATEPDRSYKFRALEQLELETKEKLRVVLERVGGSTEETAAHWSSGGGNPWRACLRVRIGAQRCGSMPA